MKEDIQHQIELLGQHQAAREKAWRAQKSKITIIDSFYSEAENQLLVAIRLMQEMAQQLKQAMACVAHDTEHEACQCL